MSSVKGNDGRWYHLPDLSKEDKIRLGILDIKKELKKVPKEIKDKPCKKKKTKASE